MGRRVGTSLAFFITSIVSLSISFANVNAVECGSVPTNGCTVSQSTTFVRGNYSLPAGIDVVAGNIRLDCNGSTLSGSSTSTGIGIEAFNAADNITIRNCT